MKWKLDSIVSLENYGELYQQTENKLKKLDIWFENLSPKMDSSKFKKIIELMEGLETDIARLAYRPHLMEAVDQKDQRAKLLKSRSDELRLKYAEKARKINHWIKGKRVRGKLNLDDQNAKRLFKSVPDLRYELEYSRKAAKYTLGEREEDIISNKDTTGVGVLTDLRTLFETGMAYEMEVGGKKKKIRTQSELLQYVYSSKPEEREAAYRSLFKEHKEHVDKFFMIYQAVVKDWDYEARIRGFKTPISARNFQNRIPDEVIDVLLEVCRKNRNIFQKYFDLKARDLNMKKLKRFDLYAPIESRKRKYNFKEAQDIVLETFGGFSERFKENALKIIKQGHLDSHPRSEKRSGAFCATVSPKITPFVLMNFVGNERDLSVLAHELGHGVHSLYANKHSYSVAHANLPLAETASTLGEMILFDKIYTLEKDSMIKKSILSEKIADTYASILRQNYFVIFEKKVHEKMRAGLTAKEIGGMWMETLEEQFGNSVEVDPIFSWEWTYIPHIVESPFYCYAYNFGELLTYSLYSRYKKEGKGFVKNIEEVLEAGGSKDPIEILDKVGINVRKEEFWQESFEIIKKWVGELEML